MNRSAVNCPRRTTRLRAVAFGSSTRTSAAVWKTLLHKCLSRDPLGTGIPNAGELAADLRRHLADLFSPGS